MIHEETHHDGHKLKTMKQIAITLNRKNLRFNVL